MFGITKLIKWVKSLFKKKKLEKVTFIGSRLIPNGHKVFEFNILEKKIQPCGYETIDGRKRVMMNKQCMYVSALNEKNAIKKLKAKGINITF